MNYLLLTGPIAPQPGNNAKLIGSVILELNKNHTTELVALLPQRSDVQPPKTIFGCTVHWAANKRSGFKRRLLYPLRGKLLDRNGYSDEIQRCLLLEEAKKHPAEAVISTMEPFLAAMAAIGMYGKKILYLMDPPNEICGKASTPYRARNLRRVLCSQDTILTTPFIRQSLLEQGYKVLEQKLIPVGFPMIVDRHLVQQQERDDRIHLLFCGWLYSDIRSPNYFLAILSRLDERFVVTFMGRECEKLTERFDVQTKAELITLPQQPYETALQAMADADVMINIGNSVPVHMPSKTLEYINTGKPFVNFYKMDDCPTLFYTKRYPLCLNMSEKDTDLDAAAQRFIDFCVSSKGKTVDRTFLETQYADCTPQYIAQKILDALGETNG